MLHVLIVLLRFWFWLSTPKAGGRRRWCSALLSNVGLGYLSLHIAVTGVALSLAVVLPSCVCRCDRSVCVCTAAEIKSSFAFPFLSFPKENPTRCGAVRCGTRCGMQTSSNGTRCSKRCACCSSAVCVSLAVRAAKACSTSSERKA